MMSRCARLVIVCSSMFGIGIFVGMQIVPIYFGLLAGLLFGFFAEDLWRWIQS